MQIITILWLAIINWRFSQSHGPCLGGNKFVFSFFLFINCIYIWTCREKHHLRHLYLIICTFCTKLRISSRYFKENLSENKSYACEKMKRILQRIAIKHIILCLYRFQKIKKPSKVARELSMQSKTNSTAKCKYLTLSGNLTKSAW